MLAAGVPAREKKPLSGAAERWTEVAVDDYQELRRRYLAEHARAPTKSAAVASVSETG
jgi:hypothetical protein